MKPRMLWFCQSVALAISAIVAPSLRRRSSNTIAFFVSPRLWPEISLACHSPWPFSSTLALLSQPPSPLWLPSLSSGSFAGVFFSREFFVHRQFLSAVDPRLTIHHSGSHRKASRKSGIRSLRESNLRVRGYTTTKTFGAHSRRPASNTRVTGRDLIESVPRIFVHFMIGTKLAHYEITSHLGSGGMGDVYQATDSKLGRSVAIKFLPEAFTHDNERVARFEREARVLASLNHPNIAAIHGLEESGGRKFLVMELVSGETLADRIAERADSGG